MLDRSLEWFDRHKFGVIGTLVLHTMVLFTFAVLSLKQETPDSERGELRLALEPPITQEEFDQIEAQLAQAVEANGDVKNLTSNVTAKVSDRSYPSQATQERMAAMSEAELKTFEQEEFDRLAQERKDRGEEMTVPALDPSKWRKELYMEKAAEPVKVEGSTLVSHNLTGRTRGEHKPGYLCKAAGLVVINVEVDPDGSIRRAELDEAQSAGADDCMIEQALHSARIARFDRSSTAPSPQRGWIRFMFVPQ